MDAAAALNAAELEDRLTALESARAWSPRVVSRLESRVRDADDLALFRINPKTYAVEASMAEDEAIDLFLHAAAIGLFEMDWILVCAACGNTARSFRSLKKVDPHFVCELCQMDNHTTLDEYIQVAFTVSPRVRSIPYHDPDSLSAHDRYFNYQVSRDIRPDSHGPTTLPALTSSTHLISYIEPGGIATAEFEFSGDAFAVRDPLHAASVVYLPRPDTATEASANDPTPATRVSLILDADGMRDRDRVLEAWEFNAPQGAEMRLLFPGMAMVPEGAIAIDIENAMTERASIWIVEYPQVPLVFEPLRFVPILSAKQVLSTQTFRTLFRSESLVASESLQVQDLTFLFTDLRDSTAMYERIGDASAYNLVRLHFDALEVAIREHGGAIVKTIGDAIMATFIEPAAGVRAAIGMSRRLEAFNQAGSTDLVLKMGMHRGHAIAVSSNDSIDYFGQTVNIAARIQGMAGSGDVCLSEDVYSAPGVSEILDGAAVEPEAAVMKGVSEEIPVYRIRLT